MKQILIIDNPETQLTLGNKTHNDKNTSRNITRI
jgi:hypothetical protein